jgi:hypothetical protein
MPILGARHPAALGQAARDCWPEIWDTIEPLLRGVLETGEPVWAEDMPFTLEPRPEGGSHARVVLAVRKRRPETV